MKMKFYSTKHLVDFGGGPDLNKRFIHRLELEQDVAQLRASDPIKGWTKKDDKALAAYLAVLNADDDG